MLTSQLYRTPDLVDTIGWSAIGLLFVALAIVANADMIDSIYQGFKALIGKIIK